MAGVGLLTGWGEGPGALPADAASAASRRQVIPVMAPPMRGERFRRATRECLLGVGAVEVLVRDLGLDRAQLRGPGTALVYVTAAAYGAANVAFIEGPAAGTLHFPYTAPSAVPGEVAIEFGLTGPYVILLGGAAATIDALWQATRLLENGVCERALVLAVETFADTASLWARARGLLRSPLVEAAACALLLPGGLPVAYTVGQRATSLEALARRRSGETLACAPLVALSLALRERPGPRLALSGEWRGRRVGLAWGRDEETDGFGRDS